MSAVRLSYYQGLLAIYAPGKVSEAYARLIRAAREEAGKQMADAWRAKPLRVASEYTTVKKYDRTLSDLEKAVVVKLMKVWWRR